MPTRGMRWLVSDFSYRDGEKKEQFEYSRAEVLTAYKDRISTGQPMDGISELGGLDRQLLQSPEFFAVGTTILKKVTPEDEIDELDLDTTWIPKEAKDSLLLMSLYDIDPIPLRQALLVSKNNLDALAFIAENLREWDESNQFDAMTYSERGLDTISDTESETDSEDEPDHVLSTSNTCCEKTVKKTFSLPKDRYHIAERVRPNENKEAAERRVSDLKGNLDQIKELWEVKSIEEHLSKLRRDYEHDALLLAEWSRDQKEKDRRLYLQFLRAKKIDMETIRAKLWACFDREPSVQTAKKQTIRPVKKDWMLGYDPITKEVAEDFLMDEEDIENLRRAIGRDPTEIDTKTLSVLPCIWEIERSKALRELNHTKPQWKKVYDVVWQRLECSILGQAKVASTSTAKIRVRKMLFKWQSKLSSEAKGEISRLLSGPEPKSRVKAQVKTMEA